MEKKTMAGLIAIVAVVAVVISAGALYTEEKPPASAATQDPEFLKWASETSAHIIGDNGLLLEALKSLDFDDMEFYAGILYDDAKKALDEIDQFSVSPKLQPFKDEYKLSLDDTKWYAYFTEQGARNIDPDAIETATEYAESSAEHLERANRYLRSYLKKIK